MKKLAIFLLAAILIAGTVSAQAIREQQKDAAPKAGNEQRREFHSENRNRQDSNRHDMNRQKPERQMPNREQREIDLVTIDGTLKLEKGFVAVQSEGDSVYLVPMLNRFIGFINGLTEGAKVSVQGVMFRNVIQPVKVTIDDRTYDFPPPHRLDASGRHPAFGKDFKNHRDHFKHDRDFRHNRNHKHGGKSRHGS